MPQRANFGTGTTLKFGTDVGKRYGECSEIQEDVDGEKLTVKKWWISLTAVIVL